MKKASMEMWSKVGREQEKDKTCSRSIEARRTQSDGNGIECCRAKEKTKAE